MGETMQSRQVLLRDGTVLDKRTLVVYENYVVIVGVNGKYEELVPWDSIVQIKL